MQPGAVVCDMTHLVQNLVNELFSNSVVATSIVIGSILLASDHHLRVKKASVGASADFVDNIGFEIAIDRARNIFALT